MVTYELNRWFHFDFGGQCVSVSDQLCNKLCLVYFVVIVTELWTSLPLISQWNNMRHKSFFFSSSRRQNTTASSSLCETTYSPWTIGLISTYNTCWMYSSCSLCISSLICKRKRNATRPKIISMHISQQTEALTQSSGCDNFLKLESLTAPWSGQTAPIWLVRVLSSLLELKQGFLFKIDLSQEELTSSLKIKMSSGEHRWWTSQND